jgi:hypothetical protein
MLTACIVFGSAVVASAWYVDDGYVRGTLIPISSTRREIEITLLSTGFPSGLSLISLDGTFTTIEGGASYYLGGTSGAWKSHTTNVFEPEAASHVNFDSVVSGSTSIISGTHPNVTSFAGTWYTSDPPPGVGGLSPSTNSLLARMYIDNGSWVKFTGQAGFVDGVGNTSTAALNFTVPEPGTLLMLLGLAASLAGYCCWKRRG